MFDIAPTELLLVAVVALVVIGPKDLPKAMRIVGNWVGKARGMARHFRSGIDTMIRESELQEMEKKWHFQYSTSPAGNKACTAMQPAYGIQPESFCRKLAGLCCNSRNRNCIDQ